MPYVESDWQPKTPVADPITGVTEQVLIYPLNGTVKPGDGHPHWAAYRFLTGAAGFTDAWLTGDTTGPGDTSGLSETVDDASAAGFDHRIDLILVRAAAGETPPIADRGEVTGDELADRDPVTGLWPSDHAGVWLRLRGL